MCNLPAKFRFLLRLDALNLLQAQKLSGRAKVFRLALPSFLTGFWASPLNQERATAFPFCLGEGLWCVGGRGTCRGLALAGNLATQVGRICTPWGHPFLSITLISSSLNSTARASNVAWTPSSSPNAIVLFGLRNAEILPGLKIGQVFSFFGTGGGTFPLRHSGFRACGIPDGETIVITGGRPSNSQAHNYVTRCVGLRNRMLLSKPLTLHLQIAPKSMKILPQVR